MSEKIKPVPSPLIFGDIGSTVSKSDVEIDETKGDDLFIYTMGAHGKHEAEYEAGAGTDTLQLNFTAAQWASSAVQADIAHFKDFLAAPAPAHGEKEFEFTAFKLEVEGIEKLKVLVDGVQVFPASGVVLVGLDNQFNTLTGTSGNDTLTGGSLIPGGAIMGNTLSGGDGNDLITGGSNFASPFPLPNSIFGEAGNDTLVGGDGNAPNAMTGGAGNDLFVLGRSIGNGVTDFTAGADHIGVSVAKFGGGLVAGAAPTLLNVSDLPATAPAGTTFFLVYDAVNSPGLAAQLYMEESDGTVTSLASLDNVTSLHASDLILM